MPQDDNPCRVNPAEGDENVAIAQGAGLISNIMPTVIDLLDYFFALKQKIAQLEQHIQQQEEQIKGINKAKK